MDQAVIGHIEQQVDGEVKRRFPGAVRRVAVLQHGDDPVIEPGELLVRVIIEAPEERDGQQQALEAFEQAHGRRSDNSGTICLRCFGGPGGWSSAPATPAIAP